MFFTPTLKSDLFYAHKAIQSLMFILIIAMLVMPILHQPQKAEAIDPVTIGVIIAGVALVVSIAALINSLEVNCPAGCGVKVDYSGYHFTLCINCYGERVWDCVKHKPNGNDQPHRERCVGRLINDDYVRGCYKWYYICDRSDASEIGEFEQAEAHRTVDSDCGIHKHRNCIPENNHKMIDGSCGIHHYPECAPELNHVPMDTLCAHNVYTCTVGHEDVFCDPCQIFYPACESHVCPPNEMGGGDDSSGCCDDGS